MVEISGNDKTSQASSFNRSDYRVAVPPSYLRELALWLDPLVGRTRIPIACLGPPLLTLSRLGHARLSLTDLSVRGLGMMVKPGPEESALLLQAEACCIYFQLWDPSLDDPDQVLSVFTSCGLVNRSEADGFLLFGASFRRFAVGSRFEKALEFLDARPAGVAALAPWCDNLVRGALPQGERRHPGLDLDKLLTEIHTALVQDRSCLPDAEDIK